MERNDFKFGCWNIISDVQVVNVLAKNLDFLILDLEHGFRDFSDFNAAFSSARHFSGEIYVRVRSFQDPWIQSLLDLGVTHFVLPQVRTKEDLDTFISATKFPPLGKRGMHPRLLQNSLNPDDHSEIHICLIIETRESVEILDSLLESKAVSEVYIGVYDLSQELEIDSGIDSPEMMMVCQKIALAAKSHSKVISAMATSERAVRELERIGINKFVLGIDSTILEQGVLLRKGEVESLLEPHNV